MRLGRLPHDPVQLDAAPKLVEHRFAAAPPRQVVDRSAVAFEPGLYQNDVLPNCTAAGLANAAGMVAALNGFAIAVDPVRVPAFYASCVGCAPTEAAMMATHGAVVMDVMIRQVQSGFHVGDQAPLVGLFGTLPINSRSAIASAIDRLGHAYLGVMLRERDMEMPQVWDVENGRDDGAPAGGHLIVAWDYSGLTDNATVRVATWGRWQPATWDWLAARLEEAHALVWRQLTRADGANLGVDFDALRAAMDALSTGR